MCILAFVTHRTPRFPFILVSNRDEVLSRGTRPIGVDAHVPLLWSVDETAGGSWLGLHLRNGRFAALTNCARPPLGSMPRAEVLRRTIVRTATRPDGGTDAFLEFLPDASRGAVVRDFLLDGRRPRGVSSASPVLFEGPFYAGFNLLTADLFGAAMGVRYTTNRGAPKRSSPADGAAHCLANTHLDNWAEPKTAWLRDAFDAAVASALPAAGALRVEATASALADTCLCAKPEFDIWRTARDPDTTEETRRRYTALLEYALPHNGYADDAEMAALHGNGLQPPVHFPRETYLERANFLQRNIFVTGEEYGTRTQTVVVVEVEPGSGQTVVHFSQREVSRDGSPHKPWSHFTIPAP